MMARLAGALLLACLAGCAQMVPQTIALRTGWPAGVPQTVEMKTVPFFPQDDYQCGPAALATVLESSGVPVKPEQLVSQVFLPARKGSLQIEMLAAARQHGRISYELPPHYPALLREVAAGNPVVVLQDVGLMFTRVALCRRERFRLSLGHDLVALRAGSASGDAVHRVRANLDEEQLLEHGRHATGPDPGHGNRRRMAAGGAGVRSRRQGRRRQAGLCRSTAAVARQHSRGDRLGQ